MGVFYWEHCGCYSDASFGVCYTGSIVCVCASYMRMMWDVILGALCVCVILGALCGDVDRDHGVGLLHRGSMWFYFYNLF